MEKKFEIGELHKRAMDIAIQLRRNESELIAIFQEIDGHRDFRKLDCASLFDYGVRILKLSEANTYNFITLARKSKTVPELKKAIDRGELSVSKARKITSVITQENQDHWINLAKTLPRAQLEREVAKVSPDNNIRESAAFVSKDRIKLTVGISDEVLALLKRVQDLESQRTRKPAKYEDSIKSALQIYIEKLDPLKKAERHDERKKHTQNGAAKDQLFPGTVPFQRTPISQSLKHEITKRDHGMCTHKYKDGTRCQNSRWLEIHHLIPINQGGTNDLVNLRTLCASDHRQFHGHQGLHGVEGSRSSLLPI